MQFPDFCSVHRRCCRPAQPFTVLPCVGQASPSSSAQNLPFECGEYGQQSGHGASGWRGQIQRLGQRHEADAKMLQFLKCSEQVGD